MIFDDINFATLYQTHLKVCQHFNLPPTKWDKKAAKMAENLVGKPSRYTETLLNLMAISPDESVLDIGCGPGTLAVPLAMQGSTVYALDYSQGMLDCVNQFKQDLGLNSLSTWHKSWSDNWDDVPQADVVVASRSTLVDDLDDMIEKLRTKAKKRVYLTSVTQRHFIDEAVFAAIGREDCGFPTYIYLLNRLYQQGIQANLNFIDTEIGHFQGETYEDLLQSVEFSLGALNDLEKQGLKRFYDEKQAKNEPILHGQRKWAVIWWCVESS